MRFLSMIRVNESSEMWPSEQLMSDMGKLLEEVIRAWTRRFLKVHGDEWDIICELRQLETHAEPG